MIDRIKGFREPATVIALVVVLVGIAITIAILFIVKDAARSVWGRMIDGIEPELVGEIEHAPSHVAGVQGVHQVRARWVGHKVHADLHITVDPDLSVRESHAIAEAVERNLRAHIRSFGGAVIHVCPAEIAPPVIATGA